MLKRPRRSHGAAFKAKVALEAIKGDQTLVELSERFQVHANHIAEWKKVLLERAPEIFDKGKSSNKGPDIKELHAKIGQLAMENDFLSVALGRKEMIAKEHPLPIKRQCHILQLSKSSTYYKPAPVSDRDRELMRLLDEMHLEEPYLGSRGMKNALKVRGYKVGRIHVRTLKRKMGIEALYKKPRLSKSHPEHKTYPYLLRNLEITESNHVWCTDIIYIPMAKGFCYLVAVMDWASRKVLSWRLSNTLDVSFCIEALEEALTRYGNPDICNTDQGSQFTSIEFTNMLISNNIRISMDGQGRWRDNIFIERLWKTVKYEEVYLKAYESISHARKELTRFFDRYNTRRPHQGLNDRTPDDVYWGSLPKAQEAV